MTPGPSRPRSCCPPRTAEVTRARRLLFGAAGAVLVLALGIASLMGDFAIGLPLALATAWLSHRRSLPVPAVIGIGAAVGFFAVR